MSHNPAVSSASGSGLNTPFVLHHIGDYLGPGIVSACIQGLQSGILMNQIMRFWVHTSGKQPWIVRILVNFVAVVGITQTALSFWEIWRIDVVNFGNLAFALIPSAYQKISPILSTAGTTPAEAFLIWRCWTLTGRRWYLLVILSAALIASTVLRVLMSIRIVVWSRVIAEGLLGNTYNYPYPKTKAYLAAGIIPAHTVLSSILVFRLWKTQRRSFICKRWHLGIDNIIIIIWTCSIPATLMAWVGLITYNVGLLPSTWTSVIEQTIPKFYAITLFVIFNPPVDAPSERARTRISQMRFRSIIPIDVPFPERLRRANLDAEPIISRLANVPITLSQVPSLSIPPTPDQGPESPWNVEKGKEAENSHLPLTPTRARSFEFPPHTPCVEAPPSGRRMSEPLVSSRSLDSH